MEKLVWAQQTHDGNLSCLTSQRLPAYANLLYVYSQRDRRCTQPAAAALDGRLPVIFLKDVSSKDYERLLSCMYHGEVSVPQKRQLSMLSAMILIELVTELFISKMLEVSKEMENCLSHRAFCIRRQRRASQSYSKK